MYLVPDKIQAEIAGTAVFFPVFPPVRGMDSESLGLDDVRDALNEPPVVVLKRIGISAETPVHFGQIPEIRQRRVAHVFHDVVRLPSVVPDFGQGPLFDAAHQEIYLRTISLEDYYLGVTGGKHNG